MSENSREMRAFQAMIVSQLIRERNPLDLKDLPELTESQRSIMNNIPSNLVDKLWNEIIQETENDCIFEELQEVNEVEEDEFVGMNRAEEMTEETRNALDEARKEILDSMRKNKKQQDGNT